MIPSFQKIFTIGQDYIKDIFDGDVLVQEKLDGSLLLFGKDMEGNLFARSKGAQLYFEKPEQMFKGGLDYIKSIEKKLFTGNVYCCEYMKSPKHNVLKYGRIPLNHLMLFDIMNFSGAKYETSSFSLMAESMVLGIDPVPILGFGKISSVEQLKELLNTESYLGGTKIEGLVIKNYNKTMMVGDRPFPAMFGKFVSEEFKEVHRSNWKGDNTGKGKWEIFKEGYRTEARWLKSIFRLRDQGKLENSPRDIGLLIKEIQQDIVEEEIDTIKDFLWKEFGNEVLRTSIKDFPTFYKAYLAEKNFNNGEEKEDNSY